MSTAGRPEPPAEIHSSSVRKPSEKQQQTSTTKAKRKSHEYLHRSRPMSETAR